LGQRREFTGCRKDGSSFPLELTVTEIDHLGLFSGIVRDLSGKRALEREVANASALEQERIGREIHDGIGQQLTGLNILAVSLKNDLAAAGYEECRKLDDMIQQLSSLIGESRALARGLSPVTVGPHGLVDAIRRLADQVNETMGVTCSFQYDQGSVDVKDSAAATQIYRIVQEAVNNALKYANASRISIELETTDRSIELAVTDDGKGFDLEEVQHTDGFGLRIMQYRAGILGGQLAINTAPGNGTLVHFRIPCQ
jgi:signal transduction histidine kinase